MSDETKPKEANPPRKPEYLVCAASREHKPFHILASRVAPIEEVDRAIQSIAEELGYRPSYVIVLSRQAVRELMSNGHPR